MSEQPDRRGFLSLAAGATAITAGLSGCASAEPSKNMNTNTTTEQREWPPDVPRKPEDSITQWDLGNYSWMAAAHAQAMNQRLAEQNRKLERIANAVEDMAAASGGDTDG